MAWRHSRTILLSATEPAPFAGRFFGLRQVISLAFSSSRRLLHELPFSLPDMIRMNLELRRQLRPHLVLPNRDQRQTRLELRSVISSSVFSLS